MFERKQREVHRELGAVPRQNFRMIQVLENMIYETQLGLQGHLPEEDGCERLFNDESQIHEELFYGMQTSCSAILLGIEIDLSYNVWDLDQIKVCSDSKSC